MRLPRPDLSAHLGKEVSAYLDGRTKLARFKQILRYMQAQQLINLEHLKGGETKITLSERGIKRAQKVTLREISIPQPKKWDHKWRLVMFDIPEDKRQARNALSAKLRSLGFFQVQRSVWLHPFPCHIEIEFIKRIYDLSPFVTLAEVNNIDGHRQLVRQFQSILP